MYGRKIAMAASIIMSAIYIITPLPSLAWGIDRAFRFIGFYAMGTIFTSLELNEKIRKIQTPVKLVISMILIAISFVLSYMNYTTGIMWFLTAAIGIAPVLIISVSINKNCILEFLGKISLCILCIHGPVYRIFIKIVSFLFRTSMDTVRENIFFVIIVTALTLGVCAIGYQIINRFAPWIIGKGRSSTAPARSYAEQN